VNVLGNHLASGDEPARHGNAHPNIVPYQAFAATDGDLVIAVGNDAQFTRLLDVLGLADAGGRFATNPLRLERRAELVPWLSAAVAARRRDELVSALEAADVPAGPVNRVGEALAAMGDGWVERADGMRLAPDPIRLDGGRLPTRLPPPRLGEHTASILAELADRGA